MDPTENPPLVPIFDIAAHGTPVPPGMYGFTSHHSLALSVAPSTTTFPSPFGATVPVQPNPADITITRLRTHYPTWHGIVVNGQDLVTDASYQCYGGAWLDLIDPRRLLSFSVDMISEAHHMYMRREETVPIHERRLPEPDCAYHCSTIIFDRPDGPNRLRLAVTSPYSPRK